MRRGIRPSQPPEGCADGLPTEVPAVTGQRTRKRQAR